MPGSIIPPNPGMSQIVANLLDANGIFDLILGKRNDVSAK